MKAIRLHQLGGPDSLRYDDAPKPIPNDNQVLVQVHATAITPTEFAWYPTFHTLEGGERPFPIILGHEFSGVVEAVGPECTGVRVGDHIYGLSDWFIDGAQAEYCVTVPPHIAPKPATLEHTQAAAIPISVLTAWQALIDHAHLSAGQRVLIHGAAGGVGSFAVQVARHQNAHVIATASAANTDFVKALGADEVIEYRITPFDTVIRDVDVVLDTIGGDTRDRSWGVLRKGGRLVTIAADAEGVKEPRVRDAFFIVEPNRNQLMNISHLIDTGVLRPVAGSIFAMEHFRQAYEQKPMRGKNVLRIAQT
ncbi:MAG: NADP-dependent oxidoreductase [Nitrospira sp.]|jgi:NADPH:quinone reductase-like Zn-dependent oxidoreductase|nr:NADP-dependent oxidoreductase [Nitrospira sp. BO4]